jgi:predicted transglutaminase-like cysteine proteinase
MHCRLRGIAGALLVSACVAFQAGPCAARSVPLTQGRMAEIEEVNSSVNRSITEMADIDHYGQQDLWSLPEDGKGDCEDFALLKRKLLLERGFPASALIITVGATDKGLAHAWLVVSTDQGNLVLDNLSSDVRLERETGYITYSRQTSDGWVSSSGVRTAQPTADFTAFRVLPLADAPPAARSRAGQRPTLVPVLPREPATPVLPLEASMF